VGGWVEQRQWAYDDGVSGGAEEEEKERENSEAEQQAEQEEARTIVAG